MPLFKNRDTPTLSLKGKIILLLFVLLQFVNVPLLAQELKNRTEEMCSIGTVIISSESLPDKVYESQKNKILVSVIFFEKGTKKIMASGFGTGFVPDKPGIIITAKHLIEGPLKIAESIKTERIKTKPTFDFIYVFVGTIITPTQWLDFPLYPVILGEDGTMEDVMILKPDMLTMERAKNNSELFVQNPLRMLMITSQFADAKLGEKVFVSGFSPISGEYLDKDEKIIPVQTDLINYTFSSEVGALIYDMPINQAGIKKLYRLITTAEPGFSGGKVVNSKGQIIGMTIASSLSKNFTYALSSVDLKNFLKRKPLN